MRRRVTTRMCTVRTNNESTKKQVATYRAIDQRAHTRTRAHAQFTWPHCDRPRTLQVSSFARRMFVVVQTTTTSDNDDRDAIAEAPFRLSS